MKTRTMRENLSDWLDFNRPILSPRTMEIDQQHVTLFIRYAEQVAGALDRSTLESYIAGMVAAGRTRWYVQTAHSRLSRWLNWMVENNRLKENELPKLRYRAMAQEPIRDMMISEDQYERIKWFCQDQFALEGNTELWPWREWHGLIVLLWHTGLRSIDASQAKWEQIERDEIVLTPSKTQKYAKVVAIPMAEELRVELEALRVWQMEHEQKVMANATGVFLFPLLAFKARAKKQYMPNCLRKILGWLKIEQRITLHMFRHTFISRLLSKGISPAVVASMSGHTISQMQRYVHISSDARRAAIDQAA